MAAPDQIAANPDLAGYLQTAKTPWVVLDQATPAAINAAIAALPGGTSGGGTILIPRGTIIGLESVPINADNTYNITLLAAGSEYGGTVLQHAGASGPIVSARSSGGFRMLGMRLSAINSAYAGTALDLSRDPLGAIDTDLFRIEDYAIDLPQISSSGALGVSLKKAVSGRIANGKLTGGLELIRGLFAAGDYCNAITIEDNTFRYSVDAPIVDLGAGCVVGGNSFEPLLDGSAGAYRQDANLPCRGLVFLPNWTGDAGGLVGYWYQVAGESIVFIGGLCSNAAAGIRTVGNCDGLAVLGTNFNNETNALDLSVGAHTRVIYLPGNENSVTTPLPSLNAGVGSILSETKGVGTLDFYDNLRVNQGAATQVRIGNRGGSSPIIFFGTAEDTNLWRPAAKQLRTDQQLIAIDGVVTKVIAGVPSDASFAVTPPDGMLAIDSLTDALYARIGGAWVAV